MKKKLLLFYFIICFFHNKIFSVIQDLENINLLQLTNFAPDTAKYEPSPIIDNYIKENRIFIAEVKFPRSTKYYSFTENVDIGILVDLLKSNALSISWFYYDKVESNLCSIL